MHPSFDHSYKQWLSLSPGNKCGIMDQFVSLMAKEGHALLIDCKNYSQEHIPFNNPDLAVLVTDTGVRHELVEGHYNARRESCISAATKLGLSPNKLRSATMEQLNEGKYCYTKTICMLNVLFQLAKNC